MKKVNYVIVAAFIAILGVFSSCTPTDVDPVGPEIVAQNDTWATKVLAVNDEFEFSFLVKEGDANIESLTAVLTGNGMTQTLFDSEVNQTPSVSDMDIVPVVVSKVMTMDGSYTLTITAVDKDGVSTVETLAITVGNVMADYDTYSTTLLYAPTSDKTSKSFMSTVDGTTSDVTAFAVNSNTIDFGYFYGNSALATLASASDYLTTAYDLAVLYPNATLKVTTFAKVANGTTFASLTTSASLETAYENGTLSTDGSTGGATRAKLLNAGDLVAFKTAAGKYGVISVASVSGTYNAGDKITIDVKVQK